MQKKSILAISFCLLVCTIFTIGAGAQKCKPTSSAATVPSEPARVSNDSDSPPVISLPPIPPWSILWQTEKQGSGIGHGHVDPQPDLAQAAKYGNVKNVYRVDGILPTWDKLLQVSDLIILGDIEQQTGRLSEYHDVVMTDTRIRVTQVLKDNTAALMPRSLIDVNQIGGVIALNGHKIETENPDNPVPDPHFQHLFLVYRVPSDNHLELVTSLPIDKGKIQHQSKTLRTVQVFEGMDANKVREDVKNKLSKQNK